MTRTNNSQPAPPAHSRKASASPGSWAPRRSLLILDGLEPLQYAPTSPTPGQLKDQGIAALLKGLSSASHGLCVVTTRYSLPDLKNIHYLAVPTVRSKQTSPKAKEVIMIWDIPRESLVGQNVYELDSAPPVGKLATYDNLAAEYVGKPPAGL